MIRMTYNEENVSSNATNGIIGKLNTQIFEKGLNNMKTRLVFKTNIARKLLRMGYRIVDLKPYKNENGEFDFTRSIYVFADENDIDKEIMELANSQR